MSSLSQDDIDTLSQIGNDTIRSIVALIVEAILYTIYFVLVVYAGHILITKGRKSKTAIFTFSVIVTMLALDTATCMIDVNNAIREISLTLTSSSPLSLSDRYELVNALPWPVENALYSFMANLGDVIIIWRTYAFWNQPKERIFLLIPCAFLLGSVVASCLIAFCTVRLGVSNQTGNLLDPPFCRNIQLASYATTLATTGVTTAMICYKTWQYRRQISANLSHTRSTKTRVEKIMTILVESGFLYFLFFTSAVIDDAGNIGDLESATPQLEFSSTVWTYMTSHILGIYPAIIVILVNSQRSYIDTATAPPTGSDYSTPYYHPPSESATTLKKSFVTSGMSSGGTVVGTGGDGGKGGLGGRRHQKHVVDISMHELTSAGETTQSASEGDVKEDAVGARLPPMGVLRTKESFVADI